MDIDQQRAVKIAFNGQLVTQGGDAQDIFVEFDNLIAAVRAGDDAGIDAGMDGARAHVRSRVDGAGSRRRRPAHDRRAEAPARASCSALERQADFRRSKTPTWPKPSTGMAQADAAYRAALGAVSSVTSMSLMDYLR